MRRKIINIFLLVSIILLILVSVRIDLYEKLIKYAKRYNSQKQNTEEDTEYPDYIYENFVDGEGKEISVKMEKKTGTIDGKEVIFYEDTLGSEVIRYNFYKGTVKIVDSEKVVILVDEECLNAHPDDSFYQYTEAEDYELVFYFKDYSINQNVNSGPMDLIAINTNKINSFNDAEFLIGKYIRIQQVEFKDWMTKRNYKGLDFYLN
jgi:hypothetical protein